MAKILGKHWRLAFLVLGIIIAFWLLYLLRMAIFPFVIGLILAYLLMPVVSWTEKKLPRQGDWLQLKRVSSIILVFTVLLVFVGFFSYYIATVVIDASVILLENAPYFITQSVATIQKWLDGLQLQLPPEIQQQVNKTLLEAGITIGNRIRDTFVGGIASIPATFSIIFGAVVLPFFLFYIMKDSERLERGFYSALTPWLAAHIRNVASIVERVLGRYIRAQLMLGLIVAYFSFIGLLILGIQFAPALAILAGITELIPILGPWIGGAVAIVVTLAIAPSKVIWVALLYLGIQLLENYFLVPRIQSAYLRIHPAIMILLLVLGAYIAGIWGLVLAGPLTATAVELYKYIRRQYQLEETNQQPEIG